MRVFRQFLRLALSALHVLAAAASSALKSRAILQLENLALRHQLGVLRRSVKRPKLTSVDRFLWAWLSEVSNDWRSSMVIVKPETVIAWHRKSLRLFWAWKVRHGQLGRPLVPRDVRELIRKMSRDNPLWGAWFKPRTCWEQEENRRWANHLRLTLSPAQWPWHLRITRRRSRDAEEDPMDSEH